MAVEHTIKFKMGTEKRVRLTPMRAIRYACLQCSNFSQYEVRRCDIESCALHPYRFGHRPSNSADSPQVDFDQPLTHALIWVKKRSSKKPPLSGGWWNTGGKVLAPATCVCVVCTKSRQKIKVSRKRDLNKKRFQEIKKY